MNDDKPAAAAHLTAHALGRLLLAGPDFLGYFEDKFGDAPIVGVSVRGEAVFIEAEPPALYTIAADQA